MIRFGSSRGRLATHSVTVETDPDTFTASFTVDIGSVTSGCLVLTVLAQAGDGETFASDPVAGPQAGEIGVALDSLEASLDGESWHAVRGLRWFQDQAGRLAALGDPQWGAARYLRATLSLRDQAGDVYSEAHHPRARVRCELHALW